jgi:hypothetical protein
MYSVAHRVNTRSMVSYVEPYITLVTRLCGPSNTLLKKLQSAFLNVGFLFSTILQLKCMARYQSLRQTAARYIQTGDIR